MKKKTKIENMDVHDIRIKDYLSIEKDIMKC